MAARKALIRLCIVALIAGCVSAAGWHTRLAPETYPYGDAATTSLYVIRAARGELTTGAYSRFGWNHPGPLLYQALVPAYVLSGFREVSLKWTMLGLNIVALAAALHVLRRGNGWLCAALIATLTPLLVFEQRMLFWTWNPVAPLLPLVLAFALVAWTIAGRIQLLPWAVVTVSFAAQSHVGVVPVSLLLIGVCGVTVARNGLSTASPNRRAAIRRAVLGAGAAGCLLWAIPVVHDATSQPGNLTALTRFFIENRGTRPWSEAGAVIANELLAGFSPGRELITGEVPNSASITVRLFATLQVALVVAASVWFLRRQQHFSAGLAVLCALASGVGLVSIRSLPGDIFDHQIIWIGIVGILNTAVLLAAAAEMVVGRSRFKWRVSERSMTAMLTVYLIGIAGLGAHRIDGKQRADSGDRTLLQLFDEVSRYCDQREYDRPVLLFDWKVWSPAAGLVLQFHKHGRDVAVAEEARFMFGDAAVRADAERVELYLMAVEDSVFPAGVTRHAWIATVGSFRVVEVFRD